MAQVTGASLLELVAVMDRLRSVGGCPWDARQTHESLLEYLVEETYEVVDSIEMMDDAGLREELGDLLLQIVFHSRIAEENAAEPWSIDDVAAGIVAKLIRRHPHVFDEDRARSQEFPQTAEQVEMTWHELKAREKGRRSVLEGIPPQLPALVLAGKIVTRSAPLADRLPALAPPGDFTADSSGLVGSEEEFGDHLLFLVAEARGRGWDAETALRGAVRRRAAAIAEVEIP